MNFYEILGVEKKSSSAEIKKQYRKLSLQFHPDKNNGDDTKFKQINEAYQTLSNPEKRKIYDLQQHNPFFSNNAPDPEDFLKMFFGSDMEGFPGIPGMSGMPGMPNIHTMHGMPQIRIFQNGRPAFMRPSKPPPIIKTVEISLKQAYTGIDFPIEIERWVEQNGIKTIETEKLYIPIPSGVDNNEIIKLEQKGNMLNGIRGDIKLPISVDNKTKFTRNGLDLYYKKKLSLKQALLGFSFDLTFLHGQIYTINNSGAKIMYPGYKKLVQGMGMKRGESTGNLIIEFDVIFPNKLSEKQKEGLQEIL
jgi:DnaJ-class molecular chaperone